MIVHRKIDEPLRQDLSRKDLWEGPDKGLITCWETGRTKAIQDPDLASKAIAGELPVLGWKGGVAKALKKPSKYGSLKYLAQWQGLRGEDLNIDLSQEYSYTCTATGMHVTLTQDTSKYENQPADTDDNKDSSHEGHSRRVSEESLFP